MRKLLLPLLLLLCIAEPILAKKSLVYIRMGIGYALPYSGNTETTLYSGGLRTVVAHSGTYTSTSNSTGYFDERFNLKRASFSTGLIGSGGIGIRCSKNIALELSTTVGVQPDEKKSVYEDYVDSNYIKLSLSQQATCPIMLIPAIVLQTEGNVAFFTRIGIVLPLNTAISQDIILNQKINSYLIDYRLKENYRMKFSPGVSAVLGLKIKATKLVDVSVEAGLFSLSVYYNKSELVVFSRNNENYLEYLTEGQRKTEYTLNNQSSTKDELPAVQVPYNNINCSIGLSFNL